MTLLGWLLVTFIFLKLIGIVTWSWGIVLFPLWVAFCKAMLETIAAKLK
ncbi:hypothetical protein [Anaerovorax sp. IOR16]|nr:hypothetical protein [Anaerovorax sp. IOR16]